MQSPIKKPWHVHTLIPIKIRKSKKESVYYLPVLKNSHSSMKAIFGQNLAKNKSYEEEKMFMILRHPLDRWLSAINMILDGWKKYNEMDMKSDHHFNPQYLGLDKLFDVDNIRYYDYNRNVVKDIIKGEKLLRYKKAEIPRIHQRQNFYMRFNVEQNKIAYKHLASKRFCGAPVLRPPEDWGLYPTLKETLECLNEEYKEDILFYDSRKFVNR